MRAVLFACLFVIAGVSAMPQDVAPTQGRFMDLWVRSFIDQAARHIVDRGYDPLWKEFYSFYSEIIPGSVFVKGWMEKVKILGLSGIKLNNVHYNILMGRLDVDVVLENVEASIGHYTAEGRYGNSGGVGVLSGSLVISNLRVVLDTLLSVIPGLPVTIHNINTEVTLGKIESDLTASWTCLGCETSRDVSSCVNNILNVRVPELFIVHKDLIGTFTGEGIRFIVNRRW